MRPAPSICSGATQHSLLSAEQLVPGSIITGVAFSNAWEIIERRAEIVAMKQLRWNAPPLCAVDDHRMQSFPTGTLRKCSVCGFGLEQIAALLPTMADTLRTVVLVPTGPLIVPDTFTVYLMTTGQEARPMPRGTWMQDMPVIPALHPVWTVPEELRFLLESEMARGTGAD